MEIKFERLASLLLSSPLKFAHLLVTTHAAQGTTHNQISTVAYDQIFIYLKILRVEMKFYPVSIWFRILKSMVVCLIFIFALMVCAALLGFYHFPYLFFFFFYFCL